MFSSAMNMAYDSFFKPVVQNSTSSAFSWLGDAAKAVGQSVNDNPDLWKLGAGLVGGAATGYMSSKDAKDRMKFEERILQKKMEQDDRFKERRASSNDDYDSHVKNLVGGTGLLAPMVNR